MWDLVGHPEDRFSHNKAQIIRRVNKEEEDNKDDDQASKMSRIVFILLFEHGKKWVIS